MKKIILIFFISLTALSAREELDWIVYAGGIAGTPNSNVKTMDSLVENKEIETIRQLLYSDNVALKGLSVIVFEIFEEEGIIKFTIDDENQIEKVFDSHETLAMGEGCTDDNNITLELRDFLDGHYNYAYDRYEDLIEMNYLIE